MDRSPGRYYLLSGALDWEPLKALKFHTQLDYRFKNSVQDVYYARTTS